MQLSPEPRRQLLLASVSNRTDHGQLGSASPLRVFGAATAAWARSARNVERLHARLIADHLREATMLLWEAPGVDTLLLAAARTADLLDALRLGAEQAEAEPPLPHDLTAAAEQLRRWAAMLKQPAPPIGLREHSSACGLDGWQ